MGLLWGQSEPTKGGKAVLSYTQEALGGSQEEEDIESQCCQLIAEKNCNHYGPSSPFSLVPLFGFRSPSSLCFLSGLYFPGFTCARKKAILLRGRPKEEHWLRTYLVESEKNESEYRTHHSDQLVNHTRAVLQTIQVHAHRVSHRVPQVGERRVLGHA